MENVWLSQRWYAESDNCQSYSLFTKLKFQKFRFFWQLFHSVHLRVWNCMKQLLSLLRHRWTLHFRHFTWPNAWQSLFLHLWRSEAHCGRCLQLSRQTSLTGAFRWALGGRGAGDSEAEVGRPGFCLFVLFCFWCWSGHQQQYTRKYWALWGDGGSFLIQQLDMALWVFRGLVFWILTSQLVCVCVCVCVLYF